MIVCETSSRFERLLQLYRCTGGGKLRHRCAIRFLDMVRLGASHL